MEPSAITDRVSAYLDEMERVVREISRDDTRAIVGRLLDAWRDGRTIFVIGNGGSASTASHMMNDLSKSTIVEGKKRVRAVALTDNVPHMTAIANDLSYADVFVEQLRNLLQPRDVLIVLSGSGNSENIVRAVTYGNAIGAVTIGFCGQPGSRLHAAADVAVTIPSTNICQQEDGHLILNHTIALALRDAIAAEA
jgi:D-sedoheptulose 7-phosphate isomerase